MKRSLKILCAVTILCMMSTIVASASTGSTTEKITFRSISIVVDGKEIAPCDVNGNSTEPFIRNADGSTYLPVRAVAGALGLDVGWDEGANTVILKSNGTVKTGDGTPNKTNKELTSKLTYRNIQITLDGKQVALLNAAGNPVEPFIKDGSTYIPVRAVATALGCEVGWNGETSTVTLSKSSTPAADDKLTPDQISQKCAPAVISIETYGINGGKIGTASGFFITSDGYAVTNMHVIENADDVVIQTNDGKKYEDVYVVDGDWGVDLALLKVNDGKSFNYLEIADSKNLKKDMQVYAIDNPLVKKNAISQGTVLNTKKVVNGEEYVQVSLSIAPANSGGPLLNEQGKVICINTAGVAGAGANLNLAIPSNDISKLDKSLTEDKIFFSNAMYEYFTVPDFAVINNTKLTKNEEDDISSYFEYGFDDFYDAFGMSKEERRDRALDNFKDMLEMYEYELVSEDKDDKEYVAHYENDDCYVNCGYDLDEEILFVYIEAK